MVPGALVRPDLEADYRRRILQLRNLIETVVTSSPAVDIREREAAARKLLEIRASIDDFMQDLQFKLGEEMDVFKNDD